MEPTQVTSTLHADFHWADSVVLAISLVLSSAIGIYYGIKQRKSNSVEKFLVGNREMSVVPISASLFVSFLSAIAFIGDPVEVYYYGAVYWILCIGYALALPIAAHFFSPTLFRAGFISVLDYLDTRYQRWLSVFVLVVGGITLLIFQGVVLYAPAIAFSQMTKIDAKIAIVIMGGICTFYSSLGGMKAVVWADFIQTGIMLAGLVACVVVATTEVGGLAAVWEIAEHGGRLNVWNWDPNPLVRATFWTYVLGGFFRTFNAYVGSQMLVQRYVSLKSERDVKIAIYLNVPFLVLFTSLFALVGLVMYAYYECDPFMQGIVRRADQMVPLMVMRTLGAFPGVPGLFLSALCSAALSTLSSTQSGSTAWMLKSVIEPIYKKKNAKDLGDRVATLASILITLVFGVLNIGLAILTLELEGTTIFTLSMKITGGLGGPIAGIFVVAILFPWVGTVSTFLGLLGSQIISLWLTLGGFVDPPAPNSVLPPRFCSPPNISLVTNVQELTTAYSYINATDADVADKSFTVNDLYGISPLLYPAIGCVLTVVFGLIIGGIAKCLSPRRNRDSSKQNLTQESSFCKIT